MNIILCYRPHMHDTWGWEEGISKTVTKCDKGEGEGQPKCHVIFFLNCLCFAMLFETKFFLKCHIRIIWMNLNNSKVDDEEKSAFNKIVFNVFQKRNTLMMETQKIILGRFFLYLSKCILKSNFLSPPFLHRRTYHYHHQPSFVWNWNCCFIPNFSHHIKLCHENKN